MSGPAAPARRPRRPRRRRLLFAGILAVLVALVVECGGFVTWWALTGAPFSWGAASALRDGVLGEGADAGGAAEQLAVQQVVNPGTSVHPYLGFVTNAELGEVSGFAISPYGFVDDGPPVQRRGDDRFVVGVVGGSVALQLCLYAGDVLRAELARSPIVGGRRVELVQMGLGGYKQPQQLIAAQLAWLRGGEFDVLINLDGFNEVAMVPNNVEAGVPGWFPRGWHGLMQRVPSPEQQRRIGRLAVLRDERRQAARGADAVWWSPTLQSLWLVRDRRAAGRIAELAAAAEQAVGEPGFAAVGPGTEGRDADASRVEMVEVWERGSRQLQALCDLHGTRYFHFLQPNQYVPDSKPIGDEERRVAWLEGPRSLRPSVVHGYPLLREAGRRLAGDGIGFTDLTRVFAEHPEPLYVDTCCHFGRRGNELVAAEIAAVIRRAIDLGGFTAERLEVEPEHLTLSSPLRQSPLRVSAVAADGRTLDVAAQGLGTRYTCEPADLLQVAADGSVRARRRGRGTLVIDGPDGTSASLPVLARWPDELVVEDGGGGGGADERPALRVLAGDDPERPELQCVGLPSAGFRVLAASAEPLPDRVRPGQEAFGVVTVLLPAGERGAVTAPTPVPLPASGAPVFLRVYVVDVASGEPVVTSNTLVLTRG